MQKLSVSVCLILIFSYQSYCQISDSNLSVEPYQTPVSTPNASTILRYGEIPVDYNTGLPTISLPLFSIPNKSGLKIPINLSYNAGGVKVSDVASSYGLGWSLNIGGSLGVSVNGYPDREGSQNNIFNSLNINEIDNFYNDLYFAECEDVNSVYYQLAEDMNSGLYDGEPDIYIYNFSDNSGKFINIQGRIEEFPKSDAKFELKNGNKYELTDSSGNIYFFSPGGITSSRYIDCPNSPESISNGLRISNFKLDSIKTFKNEKIRYSYKLNSFTYTTKVATKYFKIEGSNSGCPNRPSSDCTMEQNISEPLIEKITFPQGELEFTYSDEPGYEIQGASQRLDLRDAVALRKVELKSTLDNHIVKKIILNYGYFGNNASNYRLKLTEILNDNRSHKFEYNEDFTMPEVSSFKQDHWGFYDRDAQSILSTGSDISSIDDFINSKDVDPQAIKTYSLEKINYPTGGYTVFEMEPRFEYVDSLKVVHDEFLTVDTDDGVYVQEFQRSPTNLVNHNEVLITFGDSCSESTNGTETTSQGCSMAFSIRDPRNGGYIELHKYPNGGYNDVVLNLREEYKIATGGVSYPNSNPITDFKMRAFAFGGDDNCGCTITASYKREAYNHINDYVPKNGSLRVKSLSNYTSENTLSTKKEFSYDIPGSNKSSFRGYNRPRYKTEVNSVGNDANNNPVLCEFFVVANTSSPHLPIEDLNQYGYDFVSIKNIDYLGNHNGTTVYEYLNENLTDYAIQNAQGSLGWIHGLLKSKKVFNSLDEITFSEENIYEFDNHFSSQSPFNRSLYNNVVSTSIKADYLGDTNCVSSSSDGRVGVYDIEFYNLSSGWIKLVQKNITDYYRNSSLTITETFDYGNNHLQLTSKEISTSNNTSYREDIYYPDDINSITGITTQERNDITDMGSQNAYRISSIISKEIYKDGSNKLQRSLYTFKSIDNSFKLPSRILNGKGNSQFIEAYNYHSYDDQGNPTEVSKADGSHTLYIWGYNKAYAIAKVENATSVQISPYLSNIQSLSDSDNDRTQGYSGKEGLLRQALDSLREALPNAMVTTYTYDPLIGVTSITDPKGYTIYYEYDSFNRLEKVRDAEGNIMSENMYNYKLNNPE